MSTKEAMKLEKIMEQAQVFASAWSLVGGRFDSGNMLDEAEAAKEELRQMVAEALAEQPARPYRLLQDNGSKYFGDSWDKAEQPAQRTWVGLTQDEFRDFASTLEYGTGGLIRAIEAKLKEKNT